MEPYSLEEYKSLPLIIEVSDHLVHNGGGIAYRVTLIEFDSGEIHRFGFIKKEKK